MISVKILDVAFFFIILFTVQSSLMMILWNQGKELHMKGMITIDIINVEPKKCFFFLFIRTLIKGNHDFNSEDAHIDFINCSR